jgi:hypothetical protein
VNLFDFFFLIDRGSGLPFAVKKEKEVKEEKNTCNIRGPVVSFIIRHKWRMINMNTASFVTPVHDAGLPAPQNFIKGAFLMKKRLLFSVNCFTPPPPPPCC